MNTQSPYPPARPSGSGRWVAAVAAASLLMSVAPGGAQAADSMNMDLVGHADLQGRSSYQPLVKKQGDRYIAYVGHHSGKSTNPLTGQEEKNGTSILDVTDPANPKQLAHIPPTSGNDATMVQVCNGDELPSGTAGKSYMLRTNGADGHEIWDVSDPSAPSLLTTVTEGLKATHKNWWECSTGIAYMVADLRPEGWSTNRGLKIYDLSDPEDPVFIRNFSLFGHAPGQGGAYSDGIHEAVYNEGRVYLAYGTGNHGEVLILDNDRLLHGDPMASAPFSPTEDNLRFPIIGQVFMQPDWGAHTAWPVLGMQTDQLAPFEDNPRDYMIVTSEATSNGCQEPTEHGLFIADITDPTHPMFISNFMVGDSEAYCAEGGRFGAHSINWSMDPRWYKKVVFVSYFNGGVRAVDIRDPRKPVEIGYFVPDTNDNTDERCDTASGSEECKHAIQTNNVDVDDRGYIYLADRANSGLDIVEATGELKTLGETPASSGKQMTN